MFFFDMGYTLVNEDLCWKNRIAQIVKALSARGISVSADSFYQAMIKASQAYKNPFLSVLTEYDSDLKIPYVPQFERLYPQVPELLEHLSQQYHLDIIANQTSGLQERLTEWKINSYFEQVVSSAEAGLAKPDRKIFELALIQAHCQPFQAVMIGDRLDNDIFPAKQLGMITVWLRQGFGGYQVPQNLQYQPDFTISELT